MCVCVCVCVCMFVCGVCECVCVCVCGVCVCVCVGSCLATKVFFRLSQGRPMMKGGHGPT